MSRARFRAFTWYTLGFSELVILARILAGFLGD